MADSNLSMDKHRNYSHSSEFHAFRAEIRMEIINDNRYEKNEDFFIELGAPIWHTPSPDGEDDADGRPVVGEIKRCKIIIIEDQQFKVLLKKVDP